MSAKRFCLHSLGCKVNQAEAAYLADELMALGWTRVPEARRGDLAVLLTCAVTASASRQSRQMARRLARVAGPESVVASGCGVQAEAQAYLAEGVIVVGRAELAQLARIIDRQAWPEQGPPPPPDAGAFCMGALQPGELRGRGLLKVQDGCNAGCAYCIVPATRGRPRSLPLAQAVAAFRGMAQAGAQEIVLTGIHLGRWGLDLAGKPRMVELLEALLAADDRPRLRLSSLESHEIEPRLVQLAAAEPRLCPHFHLPLQSGDDRVLKAMGRPYSAAQYAQVVRDLAAALPSPCLGADVLVGLPGEDHAAHRRTLELLESLPISYLHVFPYSPRPGTRAVEMPGRPSGHEVGQRAAVLRRLGQAKHLAFLRSRIGRRLEVVVEGGGLGRSADYCLVTLEHGPPPGARLSVLAGELIETPRGPGLRGQPVA